MDRGARWAAARGVAKRQVKLSDQLHSCLGPWGCGQISSWAQVQMRLCGMEGLCASLGRRAGPVCACMFLLKTLHCPHNSWLTPSHARSTRAAGTGQPRERLGTGLPATRAPRGEPICSGVRQPCGSAAQPQMTQRLWGWQPHWEDVWASVVPPARGLSRVPQARAGARAESSRAGLRPVGTLCWGSPGQPS